MIIDYHIMDQKIICVTFITKYLENLIFLDDGVMYISTGGDFSGTIVVSGTEEGTEMAPTWCLNGTSSKLVISKKTIHIMN